MNTTATTDTLSHTLRRLIETARNASRAVGGAPIHRGQVTPDTRSLLDHEEKAFAALETLLSLYLATPAAPATQNEVVHDFYASLHGDNGLEWQIRAQQAIGRCEVPIDVSGDSWQTWAAVRRPGLDHRQDAR